MKLVDKILLNKRADEMNGLLKQPIEQIIREYIQIVESGEVLSYNENVDRIIIERYYDLEKTLKELTKTEEEYIDE